MNSYHKKVENGCGFNESSRADWEKGKLKHLQNKLKKQIYRPKNKKKTYEYPKAKTLKMNCKVNTFPLQDSTN